MNPRIFRTFQATFVAAFLALLSLPALADDPDKLPSAEAILKKFTDASGGADKFKNIKSAKMTGKLSIASQGIEGKISVQIVTPDKLKSVMEIPDVVVETQASNGEVAWSGNTMSAPRILEGKEKDAVLEEANFEKFYAPESFYKELKVVGTREIDGDKCYELKLTKKNGLENTEFYSMKTGLNVKSLTVFPHQMGEFKMESIPGDYREVDGVLMPFEIKLIRPEGTVIVITFDKIEINPKIDDSVFELPDDVKALVAAQESDESGDDE